MSLPSDVVIRANGLGKRYTLGDAQARSTTLRDAVGDMFAAPFRRLRRLSQRDASQDILWALRDVDLEIRTGEVVGIVGKNGSGKSTLLKLLSRVTAPTAGEALIRGRVGSLLELGTGFHPELTARENVFLSGALLGMSRAEVAGELDAIIAFAEIDRFIDTPVKRFSTGMYLRLGFAVAAHVFADILLVDEVLAVGDAAFQRKCLGKMGTLASEGRTVLFVSHNMATVRRLCPRAIWLDEGRLKADGPTGSIVDEYLLTSSTSASGERLVFSPPPASAPAAIVGAGVRSEGGTHAAASASVLVESTPVFEVDVDVRQVDTGMSLLFRLSTSDGWCVLTSEDTDAGESPLADAGVGRHRVHFSLPPALLAPGTYRAEFHLLSQSGGEVHAPPETVRIEIEDEGSWRTTRAPFRGAGVLAPSLAFHVDTRREETSD